jgi:hypothetical protein
MIKLPDFNKMCEYENDFFLSCTDRKLSRFIFHYESYIKTMNLPGSIIECGVFKGVGLCRFAQFRNLYGGVFSKKIIGFDIFGKFPETNFKDDEITRNNFVKAAGDESITQDQLFEVLKYKNCDINIELVKGNICETIPEYIKNNPYLKISLLDLDTDLYEPAVTILENFWDRIVEGGILIIDNYAMFAGETKAVDDFFKDKNYHVLKDNYCYNPCYIIKEKK